MQMQWGAVQTWLGRWLRARRSQHGRMCRLLGAVCWLVVGAGEAMATSVPPVRVLTSLSEQVVQAYQKVYQQRFPDETLVFERKNTNEILRLLAPSSQAPRPDVVWMSSLDAFEVLARTRQLQATAMDAASGIPERIGKLRIHAESGLYYGQSLAGYGIMFNRNYLRVHQLPVPYQWADLVQPVYYGHVTLSAPARSGTMHVMVESILQGEGWDRGWSQLLQIAGNAAEIARDSGKVPIYVQTGQVGVGMVIDAFGLSAKYSGQPVGFVYPDVSPMLPVSIGLVHRALNPEGGKRFMEFALSRDGQQLLLDSRINRLPVMPQSMLQVPGGYPDPYEFARRSKLEYNAALSSERYALVTQLFEQTITNVFQELRATTAALHAAEQKLAKAPARIRALLSRARAQAYAPVVSADMLRDERWMSALHANAGKPTVQLLQAWQMKARSNYAQANTWIAQALEMGSAAGY